MNVNRAPSAVAFVKKKLDRFGRKEPMMKMRKCEDEKMAGVQSIGFGFTGKNNRYRF
jgi:hypothetical protein